MTDIKEPPLLDSSKGQVPLQIGNVHLGIAVSFTGLIKVSKACGAVTMGELQQRLIGGEPYVKALGIKAFCVDPDGAEAANARVAAALGCVSAADTEAWVRAISLALAHHVQFGRQLRKEADDDLVAQVMADLDGDDDAGKPKAAPAASP